jgi:hypothetical protein
MKRIRNEGGQAAVLTVIFVVALLGMASLVIDAGSWFREQRDTQTAADAAALAAAQALPEDPGQAGALAAAYVTKNDGGTTTTTFASGAIANDTVTVEVERSAPGIFAKLFGIDSVQVDARASARAGGIDAARWVAPIVVNEKHPMLNCGSAAGRPVPCFGQATEIGLIDLHNPGGGDAAGSFGLINLNRADTGTAGASTLGQWIVRGYDDYMPLGLYNSTPSSEFNSLHIQEALTIKTGDELLFPIYRTILGSGQGAKYDVIGWVGFTVTGKQIGGKGKVFGFFTKVIWEGIQSKSGANLNYGVRTIELVE